MKNLNFYIVLSCFIFVSVSCNKEFTEESKKSSKYEKKRYIPPQFNATVAGSSINIEHSYFDGNVNLRYRKLLTVVPNWNIRNNIANSLKLKNLSNGSYIVEVVSSLYSWENADKIYSKKLQITSSNKNFDVKKLEITNGGRTLHSSMTSSHKTITRIKARNTYEYFESKSNLELSRGGNINIDLLSLSSNGFNDNKVKSNNGLSIEKIENFKYYIFYPQVALNMNIIGFKNSLNKITDLRIREKNGSWKKYYNINTKGFGTFINDFELQVSYSNEYWSWGNYNTYRYSKTGYNPPSNSQIKDVNISDDLKLTFNNTSSNNIDLRYRKKGGSWKKVYNIPNGYKFNNLEEDKYYEYELSFANEFWNSGGFHTYSFKTLNIEKNLKNVWNAENSDDIASYTLTNNTRFVHVLPTDFDDFMWPLKKSDFLVKVSSNKELPKSERGYLSLEDIKGDGSYLSNYNEPGSKSYLLIFVLKSTLDVHKKVHGYIELPADTNDCTFKPVFSWERRGFVLNLRIDARCIR